MTTTTSYGTWNNRADSHSINLQTSVIESFGSEGPDGFDFDAIVSDYRDAINNALPGSVSLCGDEFIGPAYDADCDFDGYPTDDDGRLDIKAIVESIDFWEIAARHDKTTV